MNKFIKTAIPLFLLASLLTIVDNATFKTPVTPAIEENFTLEMVNLVGEVVGREEDKSIAISNLLKLNGVKTGEFKVAKVRYDSGNKFIILVGKGKNIDCTGRFTLSVPIISSYVRCRAL